MFDFSTSPVRIQAPTPMSADQISPVLSAGCELALVKKDPNSIGLCRKESAAVDSNRSHSAMESLSAHDELGLALMESGQDAGAATAEFNRAIDLASGTLSSADGEWGELFWHRAAAEQKSGQPGEANQDFAVAEKSLKQAADKLSRGSNGYRTLLVQVINQHAALLESEGKHEDSQALLKEVDQ